MTYQYITIKELKAKFKKQRKMQKDVLGKPSDETFDNFIIYFYKSHPQYDKSTGILSSAKKRFLEKRNFNLFSLL